MKALRAASDPRDVPTPETMAAVCRWTAERLRTVIAETPADPEAIERERAALALSAELNGGNA